MTADGEHATHPVLILFGGNAVSYNVASALTGTDYRPICLLPKNVSKLLRRSNRIALSAVSRHTWETPHYVDDLVAFLSAHTEERPILTLLTNDAAVSFWIRNRERLSRCCAVPTARPERFHNKQLFFEQLQKHGIDCPRTWTFSREDVREFPYIVKPSRKGASPDFVRRTGTKVLVVNRAEDLDVLDGLAPEDLIGQENIDFDMGDEYSWWGYRSSEGWTVAATAQHREKFPDKRGRVSHVRLVDNPPVLNLGNRIVEALGFTGIADIQFICDRKSQDCKVIEMNPRLWCSHELLLMCGINLVRLCADDFHGRLTDWHEAPYLSGLQTRPNVEWYSVLHKIRHPALPSRCVSEYFDLKSDNLATRTALRGYLAAKLVYYLVTRRV